VPKTSKTGIVEVSYDIVEVSYDKVQPFRVWWKGNIYWFAKTIEEARRKLGEAKKL